MCTTKVLYLVVYVTTALKFLTTILNNSGYQNHVRVEEEICRKTVNHCLPLLLWISYMRK